MRRKADDYAKEIDKDEREAQDKAREKATGLREGTRRATEEAATCMKSRHHWLTGSATLIEIGIALSTVAIITSRRAFWLSAIGLGVAGAVLFGVAYLAS